MQLDGIATIWSVFRIVLKKKWGKKKGRNIARPFLYLIAYMVPIKIIAMISKALSRFVGLCL